MHKYEVEYYHNMNIEDSGSALRPRLMTCKNCSLHVEINDGHIAYYRNDIMISSCFGKGKTSPGPECAGWPEIPECKYV